MRDSQLFAPSVLSLGEAETPITADKGLRYAPPKLPSATSFIRNTLSEMLCLRKTKRMGEKTLKVKGI